MREIDKKIVDGNNGVVCWFYVYKNVNKGNPSICGIVIIKQLIDTPIIDNLSESDLSNVTSDKVFFFTETKRNASVENGREEPIDYTNDALIKEFIDTEPTQEVIKTFERKKNRFIIMDYTDLHDFLDVAINIKNFNMFDKWSDDDSSSYVSKIRSEFSGSISS